MPRHEPALDLDRWVRFRSALVKAARGEAVSAAEAGLTEGSTVYDCDRCQDTRFVLTELEGGILVSQRCTACRTRVDVEVRKRAAGLFDESNIPEDAPPPRDFKKIAGLDDDEP